MPEKVRSSIEVHKVIGAQLSVNSLRLQVDISRRYLRALKKKTGSRSSKKKTEGGGFLSMGKDITLYIIADMLKKLSGMAIAQIHSP